MQNTISSSKIIGGTPVIIHAAKKAMTAIGSALTASQHPPSDIADVLAIDLIEPRSETRVTTPEVECPDCGHQDFEVGPHNHVVYNLKCKCCENYFIFVPSKRRIERIETTVLW